MNLWGALFRLLRFFSSFFLLLLRNGSEVKVYSKCVQRLSANQTTKKK